MCSISRWVQTKTSDPELGRAGAASVVYNDHILIVGGRKNEELCLDVLSYDTATASLKCLSKGCPMGRPRAYASATLLGDVVWVVGGGGANDIMPDALCFNVLTREWVKPRLSGDVHLLQRTAHGACLHPSRAGTILLFGGYGIVEEGDTPRWLQDLVTIDTRTGEVAAVVPRGDPPDARAYHSFTAVGRRCYALFGRCATNKVIPARSAVAVYDPTGNRWVVPARVGGAPPALRSSHRASAVPGGVLVFGGAGAAGTKPRMGDAHVLLEQAPGAGGLAWVACAGGAGAGGPTDWPAGRAAHCQEVVRGKVYLLGGYMVKSTYVKDVWSGQVVLPRDDESAAAAARPPPAAAAQAGEWRSTRRARPEEAAVAVAAAAAAAKRKRLSSGMPGGSMPPAGHVDAVALLDSVVPGAASPPAAVRDAQEARKLRQALEQQQAAEIKLLQEKGALQMELARLKAEMQQTDGSWRAAAEDCERWKRLAGEQRERALAADERAREILAEEHRAQLADLTRQAQAADAARRAADADVEASRRRAADLLRSAEDDRAKLASLAAERRGLIEQNALLLNKSGEATRAQMEADTALRVAQTAASKERSEWAEEQVQLRREASAARNDAASARNDLESVNRRLGTAESQAKAAREEAEAAQLRAQGAESRERAAKEALRLSEEQVTTLRDQALQAQRDLAQERAVASREYSTIELALQRLRTQQQGAGGPSAR